MSAYLLSDTVSPASLLTFGSAVLKLAGSAEEALGVVFADVGAELGRVAQDLVVLEGKDAVWREEGRQYTNEVARKDNAFAILLGKYGLLRGRLAFVGVHSESADERGMVAGFLKRCKAASRLPEREVVEVTSRLAKNLRQDQRLVTLARVGLDEVNALEEARDTYALALAQVQDEADDRDTAYQHRNLARVAAVRSLRRLVDALELVLDDAGLAALTVLRSNHLPLIRSEPETARDDSAEDDGAENDVAR